MEGAIDLDQLRINTFHSSLFSGAGFVLLEKY